MIDIIPNWHPIWVHFAIALLVTSAALFLLFGWRSTHSSGRANALIVTRWTLRLGVIAAAGALLTGYLASGSVAHDDVYHANMMVHRNWALASTVVRDDGHAHAHSEVPSTSEYEISNDRLNHPASLIATQLADAIAIGDINSLRSVVAPDVLIFESGGMESSLAEYEGHHMPADMAFMKAMQREVTSQQVIDLGESATVVTRSHIHGMYKDQNVDLKSTETLVMRKVGGQWKIIHIHWSSS